MHLGHAQDSTTTDLCVLLKQILRKLLRLAVNASACSPWSCAPQRRIFVPAGSMQQSKNQLFWLGAESATEHRWYSGAT